jgi:hypothetical protein
VTDAPPGSTGNRRGSNPWVERRVTAYLKRREGECVDILLRAYLGVLKKQGGNAGEAFRLFDEFTRTVAKRLAPRRRRGKADPALDARILAAGDAAPPGQREKAIAEAVDAENAREFDAARKRYYRRSSERDVLNKRLAEVTARMRRKLGLPPRRPLFENVESPSPANPPEGTNT